MGPTQLFEQLSVDEQQRAERIRDSKLREYWVNARAVLRLLLARYYGLPADKIVFSHNEWGKPSVANSSITVHLHFNYSHAGSRALLALSTAGPVGVDIERLRPISEMDTIIRRFFSVSEQAAITAAPKPQQLVSFYRVWTRKEAYVKALGVGLSGGLADFDVSSARSGHSLLLAVNGNAQTARRWTLADSNVGVDYAAAVAVRARNLSVSRYDVLSRRDAADGCVLSICSAQDED